MRQDETMNSTRAVKDGAVFRRPSCGGGAGPRDAEPASPGTEADSRRAGTGAPGTETGCRLCARRCGADRSAGPGFCGETAVVRAARAALHMWEEPCISGENGSGAVFFSGCPLQCVFCQNRPIALGRTGWEVSCERLAEIFLQLQAKGANNINLVTPTQFVPQIVRAAGIARGRLRIPFVYNTGSYETAETVRMLKGTVDIFLPDLKYRSPELSARYSGAPDYFETACAAIAEMVKIAGKPRFDGRGIMTGGVIVRHMILPGHTKDSMDVIDYLHGEYGDDIYISIMNQYTPMPGIGEKDPELGRKVTRREYGKVVDYALGIGVGKAFIQEGGTAEESFIPGFDGEGII